MWTATHIDIFLVEVQGHLLFVRHVGDKLQFVIFLSAVKYCDHFFPGRYLLNDIVMGGNKLLHPIFNGD